MDWSSAIGKPLLFYHIPKTGGTSFGEALSANFYPKEISSAYDDNSLIAELLSDQSKRRFYQGHFTLGTARGYLADAIFVTMIRDPIERAKSQIDNWRDVGRIQSRWHSEDWSRVFAEKLEDLSGSTPMHFLQSDHTPIVAGLSNLMTQFFCFSRFDDDCFKPDFFSESILRQALDNFHRYIDWFGVLESLDSSMIDFGRKFGTPDLQLKSKNVTQFKQGYDDESQNLVESLNRLDIELYLRLKSEFESNITNSSGVDNLFNKLKEPYYTRGRQISDSQYLFYIEPQDINFIYGWHFVETHGSVVFRWGGAQGRRSDVAVVSDKPIISVRIWIYESVKNAPEIDVFIGNQQLIFNNKEESARFTIFHYTVFDKVYSNVEPFTRLQLFSSEVIEAGELIERRILTFPISRIEFVC